MVHYVSVNSLPKLTRAGTFEIEMHLLKRNIRWRAHKLGELCKKLARGVGKILKYLIFIPCLPNVCFFILADKVMSSTKSESTVETSDDIIYFPTPMDYGDDSFHGVVIETREVDG
ncbi:hypothetical protein F4811DRAFT_574556 [Daldinia bambusicola]|nr:hypothetical protein F4811DRAFT_574556 [Daldinia bambusicola]